MYKVIQIVIRLALLKVKVLSCVLNDKQISYYHKIGKSSQHVSISSTTEEKVVYDFALRKAIFVTGLLFAILPHFFFRISRLTVTKLFIYLQAADNYVYAYQQFQATPSMIPTQNLLNP